MKEPLLTDQGVFDRAFAQLLELDDRLVPVAEVAGRPALRRRPPGFAGLCAVVIAQQVSVAAARAIAARFEAALGGEPTVEAMLCAPVETLRAAGLSAPKIRTLTGIARALDDKAQAEDFPMVEVFAALLGLAAILGLAWLIRSDF